MTSLSKVLEAQSIRHFDRPADRIRQHRQASNQAIVIVEGPSDVRVLRPHLDAVAFFPVDGKTNAVNCARSLKEWGFDNFICVTDKDFDDPNEFTDIEICHHPYLLRDLEAMLIEMGVLTHVLEHLGSSDKLKSLGGAAALVSRLEELVRPVTLLRYRNSRENWGLPFDGVDLASKIVKRELTLKINNYCVALVQASGSAATVSALVSAIEEGQTDELGPRGKDVVAGAVVALRQVAGSLKHGVDEDVLVAQLHSSCGLALSKSAWLAGLREKLRLAS
ncbi:hypothetical protein [Paenarthrobacter nicotinovorans]|uniref:hypothetical protein n=1 Tax=Paenarthrobacter nicotinovorans TaxID=29320 RepID=UPI00119F0FF1|nr:hypothetical protein [Paenarthrobacter nicotinovorans]